MPPRQTLAAQSDRQWHPAGMWGAGGTIALGIGIGSTPLGWGVGIIGGISFLLSADTAITGVETISTGEIQETEFNEFLVEDLGLSEDEAFWIELTTNFGVGAAELGLLRASAKLAAAGLDDATISLIRSVRGVCGGDCEHAAVEIAKRLPGGKQRYIGGPGLLHSVYDHGGKVYDLTAAQYMRPGMWTSSELAKAGLSEAVASGVFTLEQHAAFMKKVIDVLEALEK